jgi:hypothetical protein
MAAMESRPTVFLSAPSAPSAVYDFLSAVGSAKVDALHDFAFRRLLQFSNSPFKIHHSRPPLLHFAFCILHSAFSSQPGLDKN